MLVFVLLTTFIILHFEICIFNLKCGYRIVAIIRPCQG
jgi:hypothetical protein